MLAIYEGIVETTTREFGRCLQPKVSDSDSSWTHVCADRKSKGNLKICIGRIVETNWRKLC